MKQLVISMEDLSKAADLVLADHDKHFGESESYKTLSRDMIRIALMNIRAEALPMSFVADAPEVKKEVVA